MNQDIMRRFSFRDYPSNSPCQRCGEEKWNECYAKPEACDELWSFLAKRGDWVMAKNKEIEETNRQIQELIKNRKNFLPPEEKRYSRQGYLREEAEEK